MQKPSLIIGKSHSDKRGSLSFVNDFDMTAIKRFYIISSHNTSIARAWQGHRKEKKWFYCTNGKFIIKLIKIDDWDNPSKNLAVIEFIMEESNPNILYLPEGYVSGIKALKEKSQLIVFSDKCLEESDKDIYRFDKNYWFSWEK